MTALVTKRQPLAQLVCCQGAAAAAPTVAGRHCPCTAAFLLAGIAAAARRRL